MNMGALVWGIGGGLLLYFLTCNFLTLLVKPSWEEPIRTISDLLERDMGLILWAYSGYFRKVMRNSHVEQYNKESLSFKNHKTFFFYFQLAEKTVSYMDWDTTDQRVKEI